MLTVVQLVTDQLKRRSNVMLPLFLRQLNPTITQTVRKKQSKSRLTLYPLFKPVLVERKSHDTDVGAELSGCLEKKKIIKILDTFRNMESIRKLSKTYGLDDTFFNTIVLDFKKYCLECKSLPPDLHIILSDINKGAGNITDIFPYFLSHAKTMYPHIDFMEELKKISDLRNPPSWYHLARLKRRKLIFHVGPTNSGKTYQALQNFVTAKSGVYCGPLKLLANEIFNKCNAMGTPCDLITGEEHRYANNDGSPANHVSCSIEMVNVQNNYDIAVIDEIQLIRDNVRGWAWTRALLGIAANEIHLCGESAAIPIVKAICESTGEQLEVKYYKRLTDLKVEDQALGSLSQVMSGDCIVCFNRNDIFTVSNAIEKLGKQVAVIYGSLPPGTKLAQAARFNDPNDPCKILVATNAIGMGLNLHIRRVIFYTVKQLTMKDDGEVVSDTISISSALQIGGRAGRYGTKWPTGYVTTFKSEDLPVLKNLMAQSPEHISQAGLHPTAEQIELYAYYLPKSSLSDIIKIFITLCQVDQSLYFICNLDDFTFVADMINHIPLTLRMRYIFCCAPLNRKVPFACNMLLKYARQCSNNEPACFSWLLNQINLNPKAKLNLHELERLESTFDILDIYLWLSYRMPNLFPDQKEVKDLQRDLDKIIETQIQRIVKLVHGTEKATEVIVPKKEDPRLQNDKSQKRKLLSQLLISKGLLTPKMLQQLKLEWKSLEDDKRGMENDNQYEKPKYRR